MTEQEADFIGSMNMCDEISNEAYKKIMCNCEVEEKECGDCISRQVVKDMLTAEWTKYMPMELDMNLSFVLDKISVLPSVTPNARWIPCSDKMPDINIHVLAQFVMGGMAECYYAHNWWHIVGGFRISGDEVIAWQPLPQLYMAESEEEK